jgi:tRNA A-37 threonylcarbamoyl transferase component Bud32
MLKPDDAIGTYRVIRPLGAGGMGEVYLVEHSHLRKRYALKILPPEVSQDATFIDRFRIEARVMADLEHPGIVRVHNFGEDQGRHFLVMDYVEGPDGSPRTLEDELAWGNKLPEPTVVNMALQLCDALAYAHAFPHGAVIHRDLKPGNILIQKAGQSSASGGGRAAGPGADDRRVKIADFGLAKIVGTDYIRAVIDRSTTLTAVPTRPPKTEEFATMVNSSPGSSAPLLGTYDYMSPEQKTGATVDARSDLYALGLILYRMLTGHRPEGAYDLPSKLGCRRRWDAIIARCLQRDIDKRYQSADQLRRDLETLAAPTHRQSPLRRAALAAAVLLGAAALYLLGTRSAAPVAENVDEILPLAAGLGQQLSPMELQVQPTGATLRISRKKEVIAEAVIARNKGVKIRLQPDLYTFSLTLPGHRAVTQDVPVGPEHPTVWAVTMIEAFGYLHTRQPEGDRITLRTADGHPVTHEPPQRQGVDLVYKLPIDRYQVEVSRDNYQPFIFAADIQENLPVTLVADPQPLPGTLRLTGPADLELWEKTTRLGLANETITNVAAGPHTLELRRPGYRPAPLTFTMDPAGTLGLDAPALEQQAATLRIAVTVDDVENLPETARPQTGRLTLGDRPPEDISLPWSTVLHTIGVELPIALDVPGYTAASNAPVKLRDRQELEVTVKLTPLPVTVTVESDVPGIVMLQRGSGLARIFSGKEKELGRTGEPFTLPAFVTHKLTVNAEGYQPATLEFTSTAPGTTNPPLQTTLTPLPPPPTN